MISRQLLGAALFAAVSAAGAQTPPGIAAGDKALQARNAPAALTQFEAAVKAAPKNVEALWRAAHAAVILGEFAADKQRDSLYELAEDYGKDAVEEDSNNVFARFAYAEALGRIALTIDNPLEKLPYSRRLYSNATACLKLDPQSAECKHILGVWNAEVMKQPSGNRSMAATLMGAPEIGEASLAKAASFLEQAVKTKPRRIVHRLELGRVYATMHQKEKAKAEFQTAIRLPVQEYNDPHYKAQAQEALKALGN